MRYVLENLEIEAGSLGKESWRPMLKYVAELHGRSVRAPQFPLSAPWEEIGPGYVHGPAFGHWDIVHAALDSLPSEPEHCVAQLRLALSLQQPNGVLGVLFFRGESPYCNIDGHPPVWVYAADEHCRLRGDWSFAVECLPALERNIRYYELNRRCDDGGFYYTVDKRWESGVDEGVRFDGVPREKESAPDACAHIYWLYDHAARWAEKAGRDASADYRRKANTLRAHIQTHLFDKETGFFTDIWRAGDSTNRCMSFEGIWPLTCGAASTEQAMRVIDENLLNPKRFFSAHPMTTVAKDDLRFERRMWRGPAFNSMTLWAVIGCLRYSRRDAAKQLLERALDDSAKQFERSGTIWEFYDPDGGHPEELKRKPSYNQPCKDYVGHNPLIAMARLWRQLA